MEGNNNVQFHDENPTTPESTTQKSGTSKFAYIALACFLVYLGIQSYNLYTTLTTDISAADLNDASSSMSFSPVDIIISILQLAAFICSIVFGAKTLKDARLNNLKGRGLGLLGIIGPFVIMIVFTIISFTAGPMKDAFTMGFDCAQVKNCVKSEDGKTAKCPFEGKEIECPAYLMQDDQYKKEETENVEDEDEEEEEEETTTTTQAAFEDESGTSETDTSNPGETPEN